jgi:hypothetical protein
MIHIFQMPTVLWGLTTHCILWCCSQSRVYTYDYRDNSSADASMSGDRITDGPLCPDQADKSGALRTNCCCERGFMIRKICIVV